MKKFLKPTKWKIVLFVLVFLLIFSFMPCTSTSSFAPGDVKWSICGPLNKITYLSGQYITDVSHSYFGLVNLAKYIYLVFIFELILSYIISCIIIKSAFRK